MSLPALRQPALEPAPPPRLPATTAAPEHPERFRTLIASRPERETDTARAGIVALLVHILIVGALVWATLVPPVAEESREELTFIDVVDESELTALSGPAATIALTELPAAPARVPTRIPPPARAPVTVEPSGMVPVEGATTATGAPRAGGTAAERLRPRLGDRRLWLGPEDLAPTPKTDEELMRERVYARMESLNDSILAEVEAERKAKDWTVKTKDGKRWGISSEGIHLGGVTLPVPRLGPSSEDAEKRAREWDEIQQQSDRARIRDRFNERAKATRERKDQEREEKKKSGSQ